MLHRSPISTIGPPPPAPAAAGQGRVAGHTRRQAHVGADQGLGADGNTVFAEDRAGRETDAAVGPHGMEPPAPGILGPHAPHGGHPRPAPVDHGRRQGASPGRQVGWGEHGTPNVPIGRGPACCRRRGRVPCPAVPRQRLDYGRRHGQHGYLWLPDAPPAATGGGWPVVVLLHGGFWKALYTKSLMTPLAADVMDRGWAAWNLEYRRVGSVPGGGWPETFEDVAAGIDHGQRRPRPSRWTWAGW